MDLVSREHYLMRRIARLLWEAKSAYYLYDQSRMTDYEYDDLERTLTALEQHHPNLVDYDSPIGVVGYRDHEPITVPEEIPA